LIPLFSPVWPSFTLEDWCFSRSNKKEVVMKRQSGFTLIELIIVIIVLGILAITAAPKFLDFSSDARVSTLDGMRGSMSGASNLVFGKAAIDGLTNRGLSGSDYAATESGIEVIYGYPAASEAGITAALDVGPDDWDFAYDATAEDATMRVSPQGLNESVDSADPETIVECYVEYKNAEVNRGPTVSSVVTGC
jgi:MSHA pilin protein MshA